MSNEGRVLIETKRIKRLLIDAFLPIEPKRYSHEACTDALRASEILKELLTTRQVIHNGSLGKNELRVTNDDIVLNVQRFDLRRTLGRFIVRDALNKVVFTRALRNNTRMFNYLKGGNFG